MTKTLKTIGLSCMLLVSAVGCIKEVEPQSSSVSGSQIQQDPAAFSKLVEGIFTPMIARHMVQEWIWDFAYPSLMLERDFMGQDYVDADLFWQIWYTVHTALGSEYLGCQLPWTFYYKLINNCNNVIAMVPDYALADDVRRHGAGLAYTMRAFAYMDLARMFQYTYVGNEQLPTVPIVTEQTTEAQKADNPRATNEAVWRFILEDLDKAEACLEDYRRTDKTKPDVSVVYGLKARAYLWLGGFTESYANVPTGEAAYRLAAEFARKAIDASGCSIMTEAQYLDPKTGFCKVNSSWMWALCQSTDTVINNLYSWTAHMALEAIWGYGNGAQPGISITSYERMDASDFRRKHIVNPDRDYAALAPYTNLTEEEFEGGEGAMAPLAPYAVCKFHPNGGEKRNYSVGNVTDIPLMRVEEMYLIEAEATAHYDEGTGRSLLASFMAHRAPNYLAPPTDLVEEIIFQKRIEFWGEGIILFDLKRLDMSVQNGYEGTNSPSGAQFTTDGRAPWWNYVLPLSAEQQNLALKGFNNPNTSNTYKSVQ